MPVTTPSLCHREAQCQHPVPTVCFRSTYYAPLYVHLTPQHHTPIMGHIPILYRRKPESEGQAASPRSRSL